MSDVVVSKKQQDINGTVREVQEQIYLSEKFIQRIGQSVAKNIAGVTLNFTQAVWVKPIQIDLSTARLTPEIYGSYPQGGDCIVYLPDSTGTAEIYLDSPSGYGFPMGTVYGKIRGKFHSIYVKNTAQSGKTLNLLIGTGDITVGTTERATYPYIANITMTNADTEYSYEFPAGTNRFLIKTRDGTQFRLAFEQGKVATPTEPYLTVTSYASYDESDINFTGTVYFACGVAGKVIEIVYWV